MRVFFPFILLSLLFVIFITNNSLMSDKKNELNEDINYKYILIEQPEWHFQDSANNSYKIRSLEAKRTKKDEKIILSKPLIEISSLKGITHNGKALIAEIQPTKNIFSLQKKALIKSLSEGKSYELYSDQIIVNKNKNTISSNSYSTLETETIHLESKTFFLEKMKDGYTKITFSDSEILKIDSSGKKNPLGNSKKVYFFPKEELLILKDSAKLLQDDITIQADEIHYDLIQGKILSSKDSRLSKEI